MLAALLVALLAGTVGGATALGLLLLLFWAIDDPEFERELMERRWRRPVKE